MKPSLPEDSDSWTDEAIRTLCQLHRADLHSFCLLSGVSKGTHWTNIARTMNTMGFTGQAFSSGKLVSVKWRYILCQYKKVKNFDVNGTGKKMFSKYTAIVDEVFGDTFAALTTDTHTYTHEAEQDDTLAAEEAHNIPSDINYGIGQGYYSFLDNHGISGGACTSVKLQPTTSQTPTVEKRIISSNQRVANLTDNHQKIVSELTVKHNQHVLKLTEQHNQLVLELTKAHQAHLTELTTSHQRVTQELTESYYKETRKINLSEIELQKINGAVGEPQL